MRGVAGAKRVWGQRVWVKGMLACTSPPPSLPAAPWGREGT